MAYECIQTIDWRDILVIVIYFIAVLVVGLAASWKAARGSVSGYFLAGRSMHFLLVGGSLFGSNIGSGHFVGLAGSAAAGGIAVAGFELNAIFVLIVLGWLFVPVYITANVFTMPEYLEKRFGGRRIQVYLSVLALLLYIFTKISADLFAGALFIKESLQWNLYASIGLLLFIAAIFTVLGGLTAVLWTDTIQVVIMIIGAFILMGRSFAETGGYRNLIDSYFTSIPNVTTGSCGLARQDSMRLIRTIDADLPGLGMTLGLTISAVWYWCSDQVIVQRVLSAKNYSHAKAGCVLAGVLKFLPLFLIVFPGMAARVLFIDEVGCGDPDVCESVCQNRAGCSNLAYPKMVMCLMKPGLRGLMLSVVLSALMSSLTSIFNSASTIFTMDIWPLIRKNASSAELLIVGKLFVVILVVISILWIPIIDSFSSSRLFDYIQSVTSFLAPPVCAAYVCAVFIPRVNEPGAFWGLMVGLVVGLTRFFTEIAYKAPGCGDGADPTPDVISKVHYLHFGILLFAISFAVILAVSYMTEPIPDSRLHRITYWTRNDTEEPQYELSTLGKNSKVYTVSGTLPVDAPAMTKATKPIAQEPSTAKKFFRSCFGIGDSSDASEERPAFGTLEEKQSHRWILNIFAIFACAGAVFLYSFYE